MRCRRTVWRGLCLGDRDMGGVLDGGSFWSKRRIPHSSGLTLLWRHRRSLASQFPELVISEHGEMLRQDDLCQGLVVAGASNMQFAFEAGLQQLCEPLKDFSDVDATRVNATLGVPNRIDPKREYRLELRRQQLGAHELAGRRSAGETGGEGADVAVQSLLLAY